MLSHMEILLLKKKKVLAMSKEDGNALEKLENKLLSHSKKLSDAGSIGYYGNAIKEHSDTHDKMSKAICVTFYHKSSTDAKPTHHSSPKGANSWQQTEAKKKLKSFKHKFSIPIVIMEVIKPIYQDPTNKTLLKRCVGGFTQNRNESFNQSVWKLVPKTSFSGLAVLEIGVNIALICFNDGKNYFLKLMS